MNELEGLLTIKDKEGNLKAVVYNDTKRRSVNFFSCKELGLEEVKQLLDDLDLKLEKA